VYYSTN